MRSKILVFIVLLLSSAAACNTAMAGRIPGYNWHLDHMTRHGALKAVVVFHKDTIGGMASFYYDADAPRLPGQFQEHCYRMFLLLRDGNGVQKIGIADTALTSIQLTDTVKGRQLLLVKFPHVNTFLRVIHVGRLCIYDCVYSFIYHHSLNISRWSYHTTLLSRTINPFAEAVSNSSIYRFQKVTPWGADVTEALCLSWKNLIHAINLTYGLQLNPDDYRRKNREQKLYELVRSLD